MVQFRLLKADSTLNIKKFTQAKFDPGTSKLSELEGEPSSSDVIIDLNIGDMVVDIKKLDKNLVSIFSHQLVLLELEVLVLV